MKKLIIYHTDLDGYGVKVCAKIHFMLRNVPDSDLVFDKADYYVGDLYVDDHINKILNGHEEEFDEIILGDISVKEEKTADYLNELSKTKKVLLRDHHDTATWMNKYEYAKVREKDEDGIFRSGTYWIQKELLTDEYVEAHPTLKRFLYLCDMFDTWKWAKESPKLIEAEDLTIAFDAYTEKGFDLEIFPRLLSEKEEVIFDEKVKFHLEAMHRDIKRMAGSAHYSLKKGIYTYISENGEKIPLRVGIISPSGWSSLVIEELRDIFKKKKESFDFIISVGLGGGLALRAEDDCKVPCGLIVRQMTGSGGGHPGSAGGKLPKGSIERGLEKVFEGIKFDNVKEA